MCDWPEIEYFLEYNKTGNDDIESWKNQTYFQIHGTDIEGEVYGDILHCLLGYFRKPTGI